jgi:hypothetical protein
MKLLAAALGGCSTKSRTASQTLSVKTPTTESEVKLYEYTN